MGKGIYISLALLISSVSHSQNDTLSSWTKTDTIQNEFGEQYLYNQLNDSLKLVRKQNDGLEKTSLLLYNGGWKESGTSIIQGENGCVRITTYDNELNATTDISFHNNGTVKRVVRLVNLTEDGVVLEFYSNGKIKTFGIMQSGVRSGKFMNFHKSGKLESIGNYMSYQLTEENQEKFIEFIDYWKDNKVSLKEGIWLYTNTEGQIVKVENYEKGRIISVENKQ